MLEPSRPRVNRLKQPGPLARAQRRLLLAQQLQRGQLGRQGRLELVGDVGEKALLELGHGHLVADVAQEQHILVGGAGPPK